MCFKKFFAEEIAPLKITSEVVIKHFKRFAFVVFPEADFFENEPIIRAQFDQEKSPVFSGWGKTLVAFNNVPEAHDFGQSLGEIIPSLKFIPPSGEKMACIPPPIMY